MAIEGAKTTAVNLPPKLDAGRRHCLDEMLAQKVRVVFLTAAFAGPKLNVRVVVLTADGQKQQVSPTGLEVALICR